MIKTEKIVTRSLARKPEVSFDMTGYVKSLIRNTELRIEKNKKTYKDGLEKLEKAHPEKSVWDYTDEELRSALEDDYADFIKILLEVKALQAEVDGGIPMDDITSLSQTDKTHVYLMARACYKNIRLEDCIKSEDVSSTILKYYSTGSLSELKKVLVPCFNNLIGGSGEYFYGIKIRKSSFSDEDLRNFLAPFGGVAVRKERKKKDKVTGEVISSFDNLDWTTASRANDTKLIMSAFTTLCAVILDNPEKHEVIKPVTPADDEKSYLEWLERMGYENVPEMHEVYKKLYK